ncbi:hypothetical protein Cgig2_002746 [Carnegiea gigantea]|uniref:Uncharacterized protein n=1 Tax=Carnegiea gigantea TaxID=171969 RepID=A0A9Q1GSF7_9CARY|nr:hypothetical protein Cgig2_002746 [Carnegiea gigantea]
MIGLPPTRNKAEFDGEEVNGDSGRIVRECMAEIIAAKREKWKSQEEGRRSTLQNYIHAIFDLCDKNSKEDSIRHHKVWSGLWRDMIMMCNSLDGFQVKLLGPVNEVQLNGVPPFFRKAKWDAIDHGGHYNAYVFIAIVKEEELKKENRKSLENNVEILACNVRDLKGKLWKYEDVPTHNLGNYGASVVDHQGRVPAMMIAIDGVDEDGGQRQADDHVHNTDDHHLQGANKATTHKQEVDVLAAEEQPIEGESAQLKQPHSARSAVWKSMLPLRLFATDGKINSSQGMLTSMQSPIVRLAWEKHRL